MRRLFLSLIAAVLAGCGGASPGSPTPLPTDLASAPTRISIAGKTLTLDASLWRDFMPISPPDGKPLGVVLQVRTDDSSPVPAAIRGDMLWVLKGSDTWSAVPREERSRTETSPLYELVARDGPKWGPGISVDVVIRLLDGNGRTYLLRVADRPIQGTF